MSQPSTNKTTPLGVARATPVAPPWYPTGAAIIYMHNIIYNSINIHTCVKPHAIS